MLLIFLVKQYSKYLIIKWCLACNFIYLRSPIYLDKLLIRRLFNSTPFCRCLLMYLTILIDVQIRYFNAQYFQRFFLGFILFESKYFLVLLHVFVIAFEIKKYIHWKIKFFITLKTRSFQNTKIVFSWKHGLDTTLDIEDRNQNSSFGFLVVSRLSWYPMHSSYPPPRILANVGTSFMSSAFLQASGIKTLDIVFNCRN